MRKRFVYIVDEEIINTEYQNTSIKCTTNVILLKSCNQYFARLEVIIERIKDDKCIMKRTIPRNRRSITGKNIQRKHALSP